jgi:hypothetical protein
VAGYDMDGAAAAGGTHEFLDAPAGLGLDVVADGQRGEHDAQVRFDGFAGVVIDGLHHEPDHRVRRLRDRRLPPAVAHREELPDVQARSAGPALAPRCASYRTTRSLHRGRTRTGPQGAYLGHAGTIRARA